MISDDLHLRATRFGLANGASFLLLSVAAIAVGPAADRTSPKPLLLVMTLLWSVAQVPAALGGGLGVPIAERDLLGATEALAFPVAQQATPAWLPDHRHHLPGALITLGVTLGAIVAAPCLCWMIQHHGRPAALWALAGVGLVRAAVGGALVDARGTAGYETAMVLSGLLLALGAAASFLLVDPVRDTARMHD
ncbi:MFS transporter [Streptomyces sp. NPDC006640]|uniref:MFS transporter n=1 Tax=unclassified Streptomyces TaxID=2593676 RepID=UPI0036C7801C